MTDEDSITSYLSIFEMQNLCSVERIPVENYIGQIGGLSMVPPWFVHGLSIDLGVFDGGTMEKPCINHGETMHKPWRNHA
ncbi:MAG: hypothetical protein N4A37_05360 [Prolixibacteraceae bacterium]|nr:hypothetical protein [Prolixibacteraceae bacterium]